MSLRDLLAACLFLLILAPCARAQPYALRADYAGSGTVGALTGGTYELRATVGQPNAQIVGDGQPYLLGIGFWYQVRNADVALPVELVAFDATRDGEAIRLTWQTASETNNAGFAVERRIDDGPFVERAFVEGAGTAVEPQTYQLTDANIPFEAERLTYRLKQLDFAGTVHYSQEIELQRAAPEQLALHGNFPNPFVRQTTIRYALPKASEVRLDVYDAVGRRVSTLIDGQQAAGRKVITFDAERLTSGTYFVRLTAGGQVRTRRLTVVK